MTGFDFTGKTVLVTGASRGLGFGVAQGFAKAGADLLLLADDVAVHEAAITLGARGLVADITDQAAIAAIRPAIPKLDVLVNNAGFERLTPIDRDDEAVRDDVRRIVDVNVTGTDRVTRTLLPLLSAGSATVNTASVWGRVGEPAFGAYAASKHAIIGLTKSWARELGPRGIRVNAVAPGRVRTEASLRSLAIMAERTRLPESVLLDRILSNQALPGLMEPDDLASAYLFLASPLAACITGQTLGVDRGEVPW
jgi:3-hydroxybutyrate dehydrogenase